MLGHRTLNVEDYTAILKRRWWIIAIPGLLFAIAGLIATFFIAPKYLSQTLVLIENQKVPDDYVKSVISADLDSRLASMKEQILSRSRIQPIIDKYNLYAGSGSMDDRIDIVRKEIQIKPIRSEISRAGGLPGFFISFTANDPHTAQLVCGEIVSLFVSENLRSRAASAEGTTDFLKGQLGDAKRNLDDQDAKLAQFQRQYVGKLPGQESPNVNMLSSLNIQLEAANQALSRMEQDKTYEEAMLGQQIQNNPIPAGPGTQGAGIVKSLTLQSELQTLVAQEAELSSHYTADYPDVIAARRKIAEMRQQIAALPPVPTPSANAATVTPGAIPPASRYDSSAVQQLRSQIHALDLGIDDKRKEQAQIQGNIHIYQDRIQSSPLVEEQYKQLTRDYQTAQTFYDSLLAKMNQSKMATDLEKRQEGEQFKVMDEPNLPDGPTYPKRSVFAGVGLAIGLALGMMIVAMLEYKDTALRTERDVYAFTRLPTLAIIAFSSEVETDRENTSTMPPGWKANLSRMLSRKKPKEALSPVGS